MEICPYLEETFKIVGRSWNGLIINYLSRCESQSAHFSDMKRDLGEWKLVEKQIISSSPLEIVYQLTDKGQALAEALKPMEAWAQKYVELEANSSK